MMTAPTYVKGFHDDQRIKTMPYQELGKTGMQVSPIGFGAAPLGQVYDENLRQGQGIAAVLKALRSGVNYVDTAPWYGQGKSETVLGKALKGIPRASYYIETKVGRYDLDVKSMFDFTAERCFLSVEESLQRLGLNYVDVLLAHDVEFAPSIDVIVEETLPALEEVKRRGKTRFIGISGYPIDALRDVVERSSVPLDVVLSYCHLSLNDSSLLDHLSFFQERGIGVISASPLSMALLTDRGPPSWHPAHAEIKTACRGAAEHCQKHGHDIASLALKYSFSHHAVPTVLIGMDSEEQVTSNLDAVLGDCTPEELKLTQEILDKYFTPLHAKDWGWNAVNLYRKELLAAQKQSTADEESQN